MTLPRISPHVRDRVARTIALSVIVAVGVIIGALGAGYRPVVLQTGSMGETAPPKSLIVAVPRAAEDVVAGDILVMRRRGATPVTHRVIEIESSGSTRFAITQGDANVAPDAAPYALAGEQLVSRWILPGWGGVIQYVFQPAIALGVVLLALIALAFQALRSIWERPTKAIVANQLQPVPATVPRRKARRSNRARRALAIVTIPAVGLMTAGVAWSLFDSADSVTSNDFTTADCFDAQLGSVQSGETIHAVDGNVTVPITAVDPTGSFVMASIRSASNEPADSVVQVQLASGGTVLELDRSTDNGVPDPVTVAWSVVEYSCGLSVQRGTLVGDGTNQLDIAIGAIDPAASFALVSTATEAGATSFDADDLFIAELTSPTNLRIRTTGAVFGATRSFAWQVVSFSDPGDISVQTVATTLGAGVASDTIALSTPADPSSTFLLSNVVSASTGPDIGERLIRTHLLDANTVSVSRAFAGDSIDVSVQVVTLKDGSAVRHGTIDFSPGQPVRTVAIEPIDPARSTAISTVAVPGMTGGGQTDHVLDDVVGEASATFVVTDAETVSVQRAATASNASFGWQVIEWAGPQWWDPTYTFRQRIDVDTGAVAAPDEYSVPLTFDHNALVGSGLSRADGTDVRVVRWDGATWTELDRVLDDDSLWNQVATTLWFRTTDPIAASNTSTYWLYLGNNTPAVTLADPENVWLLTEDFESGTLGDFEDRTGGTGWYAASPWTRRIPVTVPAGRVSADLTEFPLLVSLNVADLGANAQTDGSDIRFTAADGVTPLAHQIETWTPGTGSLEAWVNVPTIATGAATTVYAYYGSADAPEQADIRATWPSLIEAVWHLNRDPSGSSPQADDASVQNHDGLSLGTMTSGDQVAGLVGTAVDFDGVDDMIVTDSFDIAGTGQLTLSGWVNLDAYTAHGRVVTKASDTLNRIFELSISNTGAVRTSLSLNGTAQELESGAGVVSLGAWHHIASTWDGGTLRVFVDGTELVNMPAAGVVDTDPTMPVTIGGITTVDRQVDGVLDEIRIESIARPAAWLAGIEASQRNPGTFHVVGGVESGTWFDQGTWGFRKPVAVDADLVAVDAADFALLVQLVDADLQTSATASGADFVFTDADGTTRFDHVVEAWDSATGTLTAWVSVPLLSSTTDTDLFLYYGNAGASDAQDSEAVFGPNADLAFLGGS